MTPMTPQEAVGYLLDRPMVEWNDAITGTKVERRREFVSVLDNLIERAAYLREYLNYCGQGHAFAVRRAGITAVRVRQALGYKTTTKVRF